MRKLLIAALSVISLSASAQAPNMQDAAKLGRYKDQNKSVPAGTVVFAGNSITDAWPRHSPEFFQENNFTGRGISGQTSQGLLLRFRQDVIDLKPAAVVINIGTNDIAQNNGPFSPQLTFDCIKSMAELADYHGIKVIITSVLPVREYGWRREVKDVPAKIDALNVDLKAYAASKGFAYIDYNTPMREPDGGMKAAYSGDGVHPNKEGYAVMEAEALRVVPQILGQKNKKAKKSKKGTAFVGASAGVSR